MVIVGGIIASLPFLDTWIWLIVDDSIFVARFSSSTYFGLNDIAANDIANAATNRYDFFIFIMAFRKTLPYY